MKKLIIAAMCCTTVALTSCAERSKSSNRDMAEKQEQLMSEANRQLGMPAITNFQERRLAKMIFELRDKEDLVCYAYIVSQMQGKLVFIGKCIGYGLPYSTQYTNPEKLERVYNHGVYTVPQADPNGLFMPSGLSATRLMMLDPKTNEPKPVYLLPAIIVSPFKLP